MRDAGRSHAHGRAVYRIRLVIFFFQAEDGIRDLTVTGVQTCALPISAAVRLTCRREPERHAPPSRADNNTRARLLVGLAQRSPPGHLTAPVARATGS